MDDQPRFHEMETPPIPSEELPRQKTVGQRRFRAFLLMISILGCLACLALAIYLIIPASGDWVGQFIPVTGDGQPDGASQPPVSGGAPRSSAGPAVSPGDYRNEAEQRLGTCTDSFGNAYDLEQLA
jgi:hypothetical protein